MAVKDQKMAEKDVREWKCLKIAGNSLTWLETTGKGWTSLEMAVQWLKMAVYGWTWLEMDGKD